MIDMHIYLTGLHTMFKGLEFCADFTIIYTNEEITYEEDQDKRDDIGDV